MLLTGGIIKKQFVNEMMSSNELVGGKKITANSHYVVIPGRPVLIQQRSNLTAHHINYLLAIIQSADIVSIHKKERMRKLLKQPK